MGTIYDEMDAKSAAATPAPSQPPQPSTIYDQMDAAPSLSQQLEAKLQATASAGGMPPATAGSPKNYTFAEALTGAPKNILPGAANFASGLANAARHPVDTALGLGSLAAGIPLAMGQAAVGSLMSPEARAQAIGNNPALMQHMIDTANALGGDYVKHYGTWEDFKRTLHDDPFRLGTDALSLLALPGAGVVVKGAARTGLLAAGAAPVTIDPFINAMSGAAGVAQKYTNPGTYPALAGKLAVAGTKVVGNAMNPMGKVLTNAVENDGPAIADRMAAATPMLPNSPFNAAQTLGPNALTGEAGINAPKVAALVAKAADQFPKQKEALKAQQEAAQTAQISSIGGTFDPGPLTALRAASAHQNYDVISNPRLVTMDNDLRHIVSIPHNLPGDTDVLGLARANAELHGRQFQYGNDVREQIIPDPYGQDLPPTVIPAQSAQLPGQSIHDIRKVLGGLAAKASRGEDGLIPDNERGLNQRKQALDDWMNRPENNQSLGIANDVHEALSRQIDRSNIRQALLEKLPNSLASTSDNALNAHSGNPFVKTATGDTYPQQLSDKLTPGEMALHQSVLDEQARNQWYADQAASANQHGGEIHTASSDTVPHVPKVPVVGGVINYLKSLATGEANAKVLNRLGAASFDPPDMAQLIRNAVDQKIRSDARYGTAATVGNALNSPNRFPAAYNIVNIIARQQQEKRDNQNTMNQRTK